MSGNRNKSEKIPEDHEIQALDTETEEDDDTLLPPEQMTVAHSMENTEQNTETADAGADDQITHAQALEEQKKIAAENLDKVLRVQAELENLRKRTTRDIENAHKYALEKFLGELLPVIDSMELGLSAISDSSAEIDSLKEGMELTHKMLATLLEKYGIKVIDPAGEKFNPAQHEAISMLKQEGVASGHIINVMQKGYELNGRLIRPAMVVVAK